jgi:hypothetical protein
VRYGYLGLLILILAACRTTENLSCAPPQTSAATLSRIDHLVYAVQDLDQASARIAKILGTAPRFGGVHPGKGTQNALLSFKNEMYLELIAADPKQTHLAKPRNWRLDELEKDQLMGWAVRATDVPQQVQMARAAGVSIGEWRSGRRVRPDGIELQWINSDASVLLADGLLPFLIDWRDSPHPSQDAPASGLQIWDLYFEHPQAEQVAQQLAVLELSVPVSSAEKARMVAVLRGPKGCVELY